MANFSLLARDMAKALARRDIFAVFQPQFSLSVGGGLVAVEGLCRWRHPRRGDVSPAVFIPLAERTKKIHDLGWLMMHECLAAAESWIATGRELPVSVNVSPTQLAAPRFVDALADEIDDRGLADILTVEITESRPLSDLRAIVPRLERLRDLGVGVSLDDCGTGHNSFDQIARLPLTEVKLDRTLIQRRDDEAVREREAIVARAADLGLLLIAEGIETEADLDVARALDCDRVQGYLLAKPVSKESVDSLLAA